MKKILIVDDSMTAKLLFKAYMPPEGAYEIHDADDLNAALAKAKEITPDIVVMDYNMPEKNGIEIAKMLQAEGIDAKFVLMTANTQQSVLDNALRSGFVSVIEKPASKEKISLMLKDVG